MIQQDALPRIAAELHLRPGERILVFVPGDAPPVPSEAVEIPENIPIRGRIRMPQGVARGILTDGQCVSWAVARLPDRDGICQITVETDVAYRGRGYAAQALCALRRDIDAPLLYLCSENNHASAAIARHAGFIQIAVLPLSKGET